MCLLNGSAHFVKCWEDQAKAIEFQGRCLRSQSSSPPGDWIIYAQHFRWCYLYH